jgi:hypothetical protein
LLEIQALDHFSENILMYVNERFLVTLEQLSEPSDDDFFGLGLKIERVKSWLPYSVPALELFLQLSENAVEVGLVLRNLQNQPQQLLIGSQN